VKKKKAWVFWLVLAVVILLCGTIHLYADWLSYSTSLNSAPFSLWIWVNAIVFGVPAAVCGLIAWILWRKNKNRKDDPL